MNRHRQKVIPRLLNPEALLNGGSCRKARRKRLERDAQRLGRPIMALLELLGRRATLRVLWELRDGPLTFRSLIASAATNPSVLNARLGELRAAGVVEHDGQGYGRTSLGTSLLKCLAPLSTWAKAWARRD